MKVKFLSGFEGVYFQSRRSHFCRCSQEKTGRRVCIFFVICIIIIIIIIIITMQIDRVTPRKFQYVDKLQNLSPFQQSTFITRYTRYLSIECQRANNLCYNKGFINTA